MKLGLSTALGVRGESDTNQTLIQSAFSEGL